MTRARFSVMRCRAVSSYASFSSVICRHYYVCTVYSKANTDNTTTLCTSRRDDTGIGAFVILLLTVVIYSIQCIYQQQKRGETITLHGLDLCILIETEKANQISAHRQIPPVPRMVRNRKSPVNTPTHGAKSIAEAAEEVVENNEDQELQDMANSADS